MSLRNPVIVAMSGGVDSSVAAHLLLEQGHEVEGLFMSNWDDDADGYCTAAADFQDARRVSMLLGIPLHRVDFAREYRERVFQHFLDEYAAGRTPNPDVLCNREIKFGACFDYARRLGAERFATGHYARLDYAPRVRLRKAADESKDQSYFLHAASPEALAHTIFPLGGLMKADVRRIARDRGLPVHAKRDSTGICFIGERPFAEFLERYLPAQPGVIETEDGQAIGTHRGLMFYTLGQRKGLGIGGRSGGDEAPWYVLEKDLTRNVLIVGQARESPTLLSRTLFTENVAWIGGAPVRPLRCRAKTRYRQPDQACEVRSVGKGVWRVDFATPQRAVTPGQYVVFYDGDACLGGGVIATTVRNGSTGNRRVAG